MEARWKRVLSLSAESGKILKPQCWSDWSGSWDIIVIAGIMSPGHSYIYIVMSLYDLM